MLKLYHVGHRRTIEASVICRKFETAALDHARENAHRINPVRFLLPENN